ncbi:hypothetical protein KC799_08700, partial [candidate division KSB1 bacterium]|nr:hypothetical protein [candidate division KSB1 bacterium]
MKIYTMFASNILFFLSLLNLNATPADTVLQVVYTSGLQRFIANPSEKNISSAQHLIDSLKNDTQSPVLVANSGNLGDAKNWFLFDKLGFDAVMPGFDDLYNGSVYFAEQLKKAEQISGTLPKIVLTNMELDSSNAESAQLKKLYEDKKIHEYLILEKADLK